MCGTTGGTDTGAVLITTSHCSASWRIECAISLSLLKSRLQLSQKFKKTGAQLMEHVVGVPSLQSIPEEQHALLTCATPAVSEHSATSVAGAFGGTPKCAIAAP